MAWGGIQKQEPLALEEIVHSQADRPGASQREDRNLKDELVACHRRPVDEPQNRA